MYTRSTQIEAIKYIVGINHKSINILRLGFQFYSHADTSYWTNYSKRRNRQMKIGIEDENYELGRTCKQLIDDENSSISSFETISLEIEIEYKIQINHDENRRIRRVIS